MASEKTCAYDNVTTIKLTEKSVIDNATSKTSDNGRAPTLQAAVPIVNHLHHYSPTISIQSFSLSLGKPGTYNVSVNLNGSNFTSVSTVQEADDTEPTETRSTWALGQVQGSPAPAPPAISVEAEEKISAPALVNPFGTFVPAGYTGDYCYSSM